MFNMAKNQKSYTPEFKQQIVDLYNAGGTSYPQLEREYGVNRSTLSNWVKQLSPIKVSEEETVTLKEYKALQKEIQRLKIENEIFDLVQQIETVEIIMFTIHEYQEILEEDLKNHLKNNVKKQNDWKKLHLIDDLKKKKNKNELKN